MRIPPFIKYLCSLLPLAAPVSTIYNYSGKYLSLKSPRTLSKNIMTMFFPEIMNMQYKYLIGLCSLSNIINIHIRPVMYMNMYDSTSQKYRMKERKTTCESVGDDFFFSGNWNAFILLLPPSFALLLKSLKKITLERNTHELQELPLTILSL